MKKLATIAMLLTVMLSCVGCKSSLKTFADSTLKVDLMQRAEDNKEMASKFHAIGVLSDDQLKVINDTIDAQLKEYIGEAGDTVTSEQLGVLATAVSQYKIGGAGVGPSEIVVLDDDDDSISSVLPAAFKDDGTPIGYKGKVGNVSVTVKNDTWDEKSSQGLFGMGDQKKLPNFIISNFLHTYEFNNNVNGTASTDPVGIGTVVQRDDSVINPIKLISDDAVETLNNLTKIDVYVLKPDVFTTDNTGSIDGILKKIKEVTEPENERSQQRMLNEYFTLAKDENGNKITLFEDTEENNIIAVSKPNPGDKAEPGYDMIVGQSDLTDAIRVKFVEFNSEAYDKFNTLVGLDTSKMFLAKDSQGCWKAYLMEYPIYIIDKFTNNGDNVDVKFQKSRLGINLKTGKFVKYPSNSWVGTEVNLTGSDEYLTIKSAANNNMTSLSSLIVRGYSKVTITDMSGNEHEAISGRIILRDYLEATFAPEFVDGENLVVFGRKLRLDMSSTYWQDNGTFANNSSLIQKKLSYPKGTAMAQFIDKNGLEVVNSPTLQITDFCTAKKLNKSNYEDCVVERLTARGETEYELDHKIKDGELPDIGDLKQSVKGDGKSIEPCLRFPGPKIGVEDNNSDTETKQRFYVLATTKGLFNSALYSSWINSSSADASLTWWNDYLHTNGFVYDVGNSRVEDYLVGNFKYELSKSGVVILDLDTVAKIQKEYDEDANSRTVGKIRTTFMVVGWLLIAYALILMLCWVIDTNIDFNMKLVNKLTFGHWEAVKYEDDVPSLSHNEITYISSQKITIKCMSIVAIGVILIVVNVFDIALLLIDTFGTIAAEIEKIITGLR